MTIVIGNDKDRFKCPCCGENKINSDLAERIELIEFILEEKLLVTSGYRCEKHNKEIGGSKTSSHLKGLAVDVACKTSLLRHKIIYTANYFGINRIGIGKNYIHLDMDKNKVSKVIWLY